MGNAAAMQSATPIIKLLISKDTQVVLYAEVGKDVIDFLLSLLAMPLAATCKLTSKGTDHDSPLGALAILYSSVERMDPEYMRSLETRDATTGGFPSLVPPPPPAPAMKVFECSNGGHDDCGNYVAVVENTPCRHCRGKMSWPKELVGSSDDPPYGGHGEALEAAGLVQAPAAVRGFVQGVATYMVMDDLDVAPMSAICGVTALRGLGVTDLTSLEVKPVQVGYNEVSEIYETKKMTSMIGHAQIFIPAMLGSPPGN